VSSWTLLRGALSRGVWSNSASPEAMSEDRTLERGPEPDALAADDVVIIERVRSGDEQALGLIYDRYARLVMGVGLRILHDSSEAQELVQEVFLYVFRKSQDFDAAKSSFRTWLLQIAYSRSFNKREYLTRRRFYDYRNIDDVIESVPGNGSPEKHWQTSELRELLREAMTGLNEPQRKTLEMFFWEGYSLREISTCLKETLGNTRNHYYRGLEKLRETVKLSAADLPKEGR
jgi:RNA polymerase sigma-70 factor, ECF subfamily